MTTITRSTQTCVLDVRMLFVVMASNHHLKNAMTAMPSIQTPAQCYVRTLFVEMVTSNQEKLVTMETELMMMNAPTSALILVEEAVFAHMIGNAQLWTDRLGIAIPEELANVAMASNFQTALALLQGLLHGKDLKDLNNHTACILLSALNLGNVPHKLEEYLLAPKPEQTHSLVSVPIK